MHEKLQRLIIGVSGQEHGLSMHSPLPSIMQLCAQKSGPSLLIFSFSSDPSSAHNASGWVLPLFRQQIFFMKEVDKRDGKMIVTHYLPCIVEGFFWILHFINT